MYLLDTDHLSLLQRGGPEAEHLLARLAGIGSDEVVATTIISYEEQTRGWFSYLSRARSLEAQVKAYFFLKRHLANFCNVWVINFDSAAAEIFAHLQHARLRIGTMDMKIAAIALARDATLLTRNRIDFERIPGLKIDDWTV